MAMRYREITERDVPDCVRLLKAHGGHSLSARVWQALPGLWSTLCTSTAPNPMMLIEDAEGEGHPLICVVPGHFVRAAFIARYQKVPRPSLLGAIYEAMLDGAVPLMSLDDVRTANSGDGMHAVMSQPAHEPRPWNDPMLERMRRVAALGFIHFFGGYRIRSLHYEAYGDAAAAHLRAGGFRLEHDFPSTVRTVGCDPAWRPRMFVKYRDEVEPGAIDVMAAHIFHFAEPRLGLTPAEQRVVLRALLGESDRRIAEALHLSTETVRSAWDSVYGRIVRVVPAVFEDDTVEHAGRGAEKRRLAVEYLRQHMHELRPHRCGERPPLRLLERREAVF
jgi:hypothetical protein